MEPDPAKQDQLATAIQAIIGSAIPTIPVTSVNTKTGAVVLGAADVGAAPVSHTHPGSALNPIVLGTEDLDTITTPGFYAQGSNSNTSTASHYPELAAGSLQVESGAGAIQTYRVYNSSRIWTRAKYQSEAWTTWAREYNTLNKPTAADIGAAAASHTHPWSQVTEAPATATRWPAWGEVTGKPATMPPDAHTHAWAQVTGAPATATRWPAWGEVTGKPATMPPSTHTHTAAQGNADIVAGSFGLIGTYALLGRFNSGGQVSPGETIAGSNLKFSNAEGTLPGGTPAGTWKALGYSKGDRDYGAWNVTLFIRIA
jgi:hypothetical protein